MILEDNISLYLATDWLEYSMMDLIQASNACQLRETAEIIAKELIKFFIELNNKGIYHRDIRPNNIRYIPGISKVTGFSFAKIIDQQNLAKERKIVGQYDYLPPELKIKKDQGMHKSSYNVRKTDIFSLGLAIYQLIFGKKNISGLNSVESINKLLITIGNNIGISDWTKNMFSAMLNPDPEYREYPILSNSL